MSSEPSFIPLCVPQIEGNEGKYVQECLDTGWVSAVGSFVDRFEREFAREVGAKFAIACASGTAALHVALQLAGVGPHDEVIVPTLTFIASANAVTYTGAVPTFVDCEPHYFQLDPSKLADFLRTDCERRGAAVYNRHTGRRVAAVMPVHILGHPCDMDLISQIADEFSIAVVEDATESLGSYYRGKATGTLCRFGCFSFNGNKIITTGNGGMIVTDDEVQAKRAKYLTTQAKDDAVEFVHGEVGYNYRLSNVSAALGVAQLEKLTSYVARKRLIAKRYSEALANLQGIHTPSVAPYAEWNAWLYTIAVDPDAYGLSSRELLERLKTERIETRPFWQPMHKSPAHKGAYCASYHVAERANARGLSLPCSVGLTDSDQCRVIDAIRRFAR
jgi:perosamine synthetase